MTVKIDGSIGVDTVQPGSVDKEDLKWVPPFTREYVSTQQTITTAGSLTLSHGLSARPKLLTIELVCIVAEQGYSVGDVQHIGLTYDANSRSQAFTSDATNIYVKFNTEISCFSGTHKSTGSAGGIAFTNTSWRLVVRAWA